MADYAILFSFLIEPVFLQIRVNSPVTSWVGLIFLLMVLVVIFVFLNLKTKFQRQEEEVVKRRQEIFNLQEEFLRCYEELKKTQEELEMLKTSMESPKDKLVKQTVNHTPVIESIKPIDPRVPSQTLLENTFKNHYLFRNAAPSPNGDQLWVFAEGELVYVAFIHHQYAGQEGAFLLWQAQALLREIIEHRRLQTVEQILTAWREHTEAGFPTSPSVSLLRIAYKEEEEVTIHFHSEGAVLLYTQDSTVAYHHCASSDESCSFFEATLKPQDSLFLGGSQLAESILQKEETKKVFLERIQENIPLVSGGKQQDRLAELVSSQINPALEEHQLFFGIRLMMQSPGEESKIRTIYQNNNNVLRDKSKFNFFEYHAHISNAQVILSYKGPFTDVLLSEVSKDIRKKIQDNPKIGKKVFSIFMELAQNVLFYSKEVNHFRNNDRVGTLIILDTNGHYKVMTGNLIFRNAISFLEEKCEKINSLNREELREYKRYLRSATKEGSEESRGAGIGIVHAALTSANPIEYEIRKFDEDHAFFLLTVKVKK